jgi:sugar phosphate isomerase/epimerase
VNKLGIRAHDVGKYEPHILSDKIKNLGFEGVQLVFKKALDQSIDLIDLESIKNAFRKPSIFMLGAYFNPVHPNIDEVHLGIENFKKHLKIASTLGVQYVGTETGSYQGSPWTYHPKNHTDEALNQVVEVFRELALFAHKHKCYIALEGAYAHVAYSPKKLKEIIDRINSPSVKVIVDLFNYLNLDNYKNHVSILKDAIELFQENIVIFHLKDFIIKDEKLFQVGLGKGLMDYPKIMDMIQTYCPQAFLIFEGVTGEDIKLSYDYIHKLLEKGV